jgi:hypothetical protein
MLLPGVGRARVLQSVESFDRLDGGVDDIE